MGSLTTYFLLFIHLLFQLRKAQHLSLLKFQQLLSKTKLNSIYNKLIIMDNLNCSGIYKIINSINNKYYIGSSCNIKIRKRKHFELLERNSHHNIYLQRAYNKYGKDVFTVELLEHCDKKILLIIEQKYLDEIINWKTVYNLNKIAFGGGTYLLNHPNEKSIREKMSIGNTDKHTKPFYINNVYYKKLKNAAKVYCVDIKTISNKIKNWEHKEYFYVDKPKIGEYDEKLHTDYRYKPKEKKEKKKYYCSCGIEITKHGQFCGDCRENRRRNREHINPIIINDIEYLSAKEAAKILEIEYATIIYRINTNTITFKNYCYKNKPKDINKLITIEEINKKISEKNMGNCGSNNKPFTINNIYYKSLSDAVKKTKTPKSTIKRRLLNLKYVNYKYIIK